MLSAFFLREGEDAVQHDDHENRYAQLRQPGDERQSARDPEQQGEEVDHLRGEAPPQRRGPLHGKAIGPGFGQHLCGSLRRQAEINYLWHSADLSMFQNLRLSCGQRQDRRLRPRATVTLCPVRGAARRQTASLTGTSVPSDGGAVVVGFGWKSITHEGAIMSKLPVRHRPRSVFPELSEIFEGFPSWASLRPVFGNHVIRVEDEMKDGNYELRAEIPGVDPAKDVDITVRDGLLTIKAERSEKKESNGRSEFSYGSFMRSVTLPAGADEDGIKASYDKGILTVTVPVTEAQTAEKHVAVESAK